MGDAHEEGIKVNVVKVKASLKREWFEEATRLAVQDIEQELAIGLLDELISRTVSSRDTIERNLSYLIRIWIKPTNELRSSRNNAIELASINRCKETLLVINYFLLLANYPWVREIAEICGRLIRLQGEIKLEQLKRKIAEVHGNREYIFRSARHTLSTITKLGLLEMPGKGKYKLPPVKFELAQSRNLAAFCIESLLRSYGPQGTLKRHELESHPALFAFNCNQLAESSLNDDRFILSRESISDEIIFLR